VRQQSNRWTRRQYALYWVFIVVLFAACGLLWYGLEYDDKQLAGTMVALMMSAFVVIVVVWVVRLLRQR